MKAMILAAGLGTRLMPLTNDLPKALVPVKGKPMILHLIERLMQQGVDHFVVNLHHHAGMLRDFLLSLDVPGITLQCSDERDALLDTGGAIKRAARFFEHEEHFLVHNVDIWTNLDINKMIRMHTANRAMGTLAVRDRPTTRYLLFNDHSSLCGWQNLKTGEEMLVHQEEKHLTPLAFSGIQIVSPGIFRYFPAHERFSLVELYLAAAATERIVAYRHDQDDWSDLGTPERINSLDRF
jgi:NDP-sugar pyrophosphorylase family protein